MKKSGFTLIELLAVIVILAIIALIASPIIIGLIDGAKKSSFENSALMLVKIAENDYAKTLLKSPSEEKIFLFDNWKQIGENKLEIGGKSPKEGFLLLEKNGDITMVITDGTYIFEKKPNDAVKEVDKKVDDIESYFYDIVSDAKFVINNKVISTHNYYLDTSYISGSSGDVFSRLIIDATDIEGNRHIIEHQEQLIEVTGDVLSIANISSDLKGIFVPAIGEEGKFSIHFHHAGWGVDVVYLGVINEINYSVDGDTEIYEGNYDWSSNVGGSGEANQYKYTYIPSID